MIYLERIRGLKCPYCSKPKYANHPRVSVSIHNDGCSIMCEKCMAVKRAPSGTLGDALTEWVALIGQDYEAIVENWAVNLKKKKGDIDFYRAMRGFGSELFRQEIKLEIEHLEDIERRKVGER